MATDSTRLPNLQQLSQEQLCGLILSQHEELQAKNQELQAKNEQLQWREAEIQHLQLFIQKLQRMQFGRRSEKVQRQIEQLELQLEELQSDPAHAEPASEIGSAQTEATGENTETDSAKTPKRKRQPKRAPLPAHLPRERHVHEPERTMCSNCANTSLVQVGERCSEVLEYVPGYFKVIAHVYPTMSCPKCSEMAQAPAVSRPIEGGLPGPGLLAHVLVSKYADHLPLYRQTEIYARQEMEIARSTLTSWVGGAERLLRPLIEQLHRHVMSGDKLHADDTPVPVLAPGAGKTKTGRLWTYVRDDRPCGDPTPPAVWFVYSPDRKGEHPRQHLQTFCGHLQADAYAGFDAIYATGHVQAVGCWAHVRRKFYDLYAAHASPMGKQALDQIGKLYDVEEEIRGMNPQQRREIRQQRSRPLLTALRAWMDQAVKVLSKTSPVRGAINYATNQWPALERYCENGRLEIDNNAAERALRVVALGRKNYLFAGSDAGGTRAAAIYSLLGTAKLNDVEPEAYLRYLFEHMPDHPINRIAELLPWNVKSQLPSRLAQP